MNNALMGILRVKDLSSPPYLTITPSVNRLQVQPEDKFVVIGSDGLFDFFTNEEVVEYVDSFLIAQPTGDPAKYMVEQLLLRAADFAGTNSNSFATYRKSVVGCVYFSTEGDTEVQMSLK